MPRSTFTLLTLLCCVLLSAPMRAASAQINSCKGRWSDGNVLTANDAALNMCDGYYWAAAVRASVKVGHVRGASEDCLLAAADLSEQNAQKANDLVGTGRFNDWNDLRQGQPPCLKGRLLTTESPWGTEQPLIKLAPGEKLVSSIDPSKVVYWDPDAIKALCPSAMYTAENRGLGIDCPPTAKAVATKPAKKPDSTSKKKVCQAWRNGDTQVSWHGIPTQSDLNNAPMSAFIGDDNGVASSRGGYLTVVNRDQSQSIFVTSSATGDHGTEVKPGTTLKSFVAVYKAAKAETKADLSVRWCAR